MTGWSLADVIALNVRANPQSRAQTHGSRHITWAETEARADSLAQGLLSLGLGRQDKVAQYLYNCPEYMESFYACMKSSLVPVNTNYRYLENELIDLWENADAVAVVFDVSFQGRVDAIRDRLPAVQAWVRVGGEPEDLPAWAHDYEALAQAGSSLDLDWQRSPDDLVFLYTGGTTGLPKGVMWRQGDLLALLNRRRVAPLAPYELDGGEEAVVAQKRSDGPGVVALPACPLMHGTGLVTALGAMLGGGCVVTQPERRFDPATLLDTIEREGVQTLAIVGDAFARPLLEALDEEPDRWDLTSLKTMVSSGVMWSEDTKHGLLQHHPNMVLRDNLGSSESIGIGAALSTGEQTTRTASFELGEFTKVLDENGEEVAPGAEQPGRLAVAGPIPLGYYKDPKKSAETFVTYGEKRYAIAGDWATVELDGTIRLLGRGSGCINTGGEKVFPEEVEEVLKLHERVKDAVCVGVPHHRFGEAVVAVIELSGEEELEERELIDLAKRHLAGYKAPKRVLFRPIERSPSGKADYPGLRVFAISKLRVIDTGPL